jgi:Family of unknown function (DUF5320)
MPGGDRTGPMGTGPGTGRGLGYCGGYDAPGFANPVFDRGLGWRRGWGGGFGWRHRFSEMGRLPGNFPTTRHPQRKKHCRPSKPKRTG